MTASGSSRPTRFLLLFFSSLASLRKPAQIRPHGPDRCLFPLFPAKPHTAAHRGKQGGSCASYPVPAFRGDNLTAWLSLVILRLFDIFPHYLMKRGYPICCGRSHGSWEFFSSRFSPTNRPRCFGCGLKVYGWHPSHAEGTQWLTGPTRV